MAESVAKILVYGAGLAAETITAALRTELGATCQIIRVSPRHAPIDDILFGGVAAPTAYEFLRAIGVSEPDLFLNTPTTFSFGTRFVDWPQKGRGWFQSFQQPFTPMQGVEFHQFISARNTTLEPYLIAAQAALAGKFAHPPEDARRPLSRAEYGYHFLESALADLLAQKSSNAISEHHRSHVKRHRVENGRLAAIELENGATINADLFIDCSGAERALISALAPTYIGDHGLCAVLSQSPTASAGAPCRTITATQIGWCAETPLQHERRTLTVCAPESIAELPDDAEPLAFTPGRLSDAWIGNCVALGHAASIAEPLSPAPFMLLERGVKRLLKLIPNSGDMSVERREFNRLFTGDADNAAMFHHALFEPSTGGASPYWRRKSKTRPSSALERKLRQFESRGLLVQYDHEPFTPEDWAVMHYGIGRRPKRFDLQVNCTPPAEIERILGDMRNAIQQTVATMPPHGVYLAKFQDYLKKNYRD